MIVVFLSITLARLAAADLFSYNAAEFCTDSNSMCGEHEIPRTCSNIYGLGLSLTCSSSDWTMKVCPVNCASPLCVTTTQSISDNRFSLPPGLGITSTVRVACGKLTVLSNCLIGVASLIALCLLCCKCVYPCCCGCCDRCDAYFDEAAEVAKERAAAVAKERQPLLAARPRPSLLEASEQELLATRQELALAQARAAALSAELNAARRDAAAAAQQPALERAPQGGAPPPETAHSLR